MAKNLCGSNKLKQSKKILTITIEKASIIYTDEARHYKKIRG